MTPYPPTTVMNGSTPTVDVSPRGGFLGFLGSIPGILTGVGAVITALSTVYAVHLNGGSAGSSLTQPAQEAPQPAPSSVDTSSVADQADTAPVAEELLGDETTALL